MPQSDQSARRGAAAGLPRSEPGTARGQREAEVADATRRLLESLRSRYKPGAELVDYRFLGKSPFLPPADERTTSSRPGLLAHTVDEAEERRDSLEEHLGNLIENADLLIGALHVVPELATVLDERYPRVAKLLDAQQGLASGNAAGLSAWRIDPIARSTDSSSVRPGTRPLQVFDKLRDLRSEVNPAIEALTGALTDHVPERGHGSGERHKRMIRQLAVNLQEQSVTLAHLTRLEAMLPSLRTWERAFLAARNSAKASPRSFAKADAIALPGPAARDSQTSSHEQHGMEHLEKLTTNAGETLPKGRRSAPPRTMPGGPAPGHHQRRIARGDTRD